MISSFCRAYIGRPLAFTVYANDTNCKDVPLISMGDMPPGASMDEPLENFSMVPGTETSFSGMSSTTSRQCAVTSRRFVWTIPLSYGGYTGRHCFFATDSCGVDPDCSGRLDTVQVGGLAAAAIWRPFFLSGGTVLFE